MTVPGPNLLWIPTVARFLFFVAFILAQQGKVFTNDYWTFILDALMAVTNGYFGSTYRFARVAQCLMLRSSSRYDVRTLACGGARARDGWQHYGTSDHSMHTAC